MENNGEESLSQDLPQALKGSKVLTLSQAVCMDPRSWCICPGSQRGASPEIPAQQWLFLITALHKVSCSASCTLRLGTQLFKAEFQKTSWIFFFFFFVEDGVGGSGKVPKLSRDLWFLHSQVKCVLGKGSGCCLR